MGRGNINWKSASVRLACRQGCKASSWLTIGVGGCRQPTVGSTTCVQVVLGHVRHQAAWAMGSQPGSMFLHSLCLVSASRILPWPLSDGLWSGKWKSNKHFPLQVAFGCGVYQSRRRSTNAGYIISPRSWSTLAIRCRRNQSHLSEEKVRSHCGFESYFLKDSLC